MSKVKKEFREIAKKSGFIFWKDEKHGPGENHIDWASIYDNELNSFGEDIVKEILKLINKSEDSKKEIIKKIKEKYNL